MTKRTNKSYSIKVLVMSLLACSIAYLGLVGLLYTEAFHDLGKEDGFVENMGALCFLLSAVVFFRAFLEIRRSDMAKSKDLGGWFWYLILALLFVFVTGEEISWGQRLFGWGTPDWMMEQNIQEETTIHNLEIFNAHTKDHELKPFWQSLFTMNRMFSMFWLSWCFFLPLFVKYIPLARRVVEWFKVPVPNVFFGYLFLTTFLTAKFFVLINDPEERVLEQTDEIKETFYAAIFLMVSWDFFKRLRKKNA